MENFRKITAYKAKRYIIAIIVIILVALGAYYSGYGKGVFDTWLFIAENAEEILDIRLNPRAKFVLMSNPELLRLIITPEGIEKQFASYFAAARAKGGLGPEAFGKEDLQWNLSLEQEDI